MPFPLIHPKHKIKSYWNPIVVILLIYTATIMPYRLVFYDNTNDYTDGWKIFELIVDILYWIDLSMNLLSCYYNEEGILITKWKDIFINYLKGWFIIDFIACVPFDAIGNLALSDENSGLTAKNIQIIRITRIPRLYRLIKITKIIKVFRFLSTDNVFSDYFEFNSGIMKNTKNLVLK